MKIGIVLDQKLEVGGGYIYQLAVSDLLSEMRNEGYDFHYFDLTGQNNSLGAIPVSPVRIGWLERFFFGMRRAYVTERASFRLVGVRKGSLERAMEREGVHLAYFVAPTALAGDMVEMPFVATVWDTCHRDWPEFPEVLAKHEFLEREYICRQVLPRAVAVMVDSEATRLNLHRRYGLDLPRLKEMPFWVSPAQAPAPETAAAAEPVPYLFYPAQLWPHKNHVLVLQAVRRLADRGVRVDFVSCGGDKGNLGFLNRTADELGIRSQCHFLGYVESAERDRLLKRAAALVMPTFFGPTNLPPLEAMSLGVPVIYSDLPGLREQVGEAGYPVSVWDPAELADTVIRILENAPERQAKIEAGRRLTGPWRAEQAKSALREVFDHFRRVRSRFA